jgi:hypothetical protein
MLISYMGQQYNVTTGRDAMNFMAIVAGDLTNFSSDLEKMGIDIAISKQRIDQQVSAVAGVANGGGGGGMAAAAALAVGLNRTPTLPPVVTPQTPEPPPINPHRNPDLPPEIQFEAEGITPIGFTAGTKPTDRTHRVSWTATAPISGSSMIFHIEFGSDYASPPAVQITDLNVNASTAYPVNITTEGFDVFVRAANPTANYQVQVVVTATSEASD